MSAQALLDQATTLGIRLWATGNGLGFDAPDTAEADRCLVELRQHKAEMLSLLSSWPKWIGADPLLVAMLERGSSLDDAFELVERIAIMGTEQDAVAPSMRASTRPWPLSAVLSPEQVLAAIVEELDMQW